MVKTFLLIANAATCSALAAVLVFSQELQLKAVKPHSAKLGWTQGVPQAVGDCAVTSNKIYRGTVSNQETLFASIAAATTWTDTTVQAGHTYFYKVSAQSCGGESPLSNEVRATIPHKPPAVKED